MRTRHLVGWCTVLVLLTSGCTSTPGAEPPPATSTLNPSRTPVAQADSIRLQLQSDPTLVRAMLLRPGAEGLFRCGMDILGSDRRGHRLYVWLDCADYSVGLSPKVISGSSLPAVITFATNRGRLVTGIQFPRDSYVAEDQARMFPPNVLDRIDRRDVDPRPNEQEILGQIRARRGPDGDAAGRTAGRARARA